MSDSDDLERRLAAVERAIGDGDADSGVDPADRHREGTEALGARLDALESRVDDIDAAVQSIRGFMGGVSAVNEAVERRADAAVAAVERLEARLDGDDAGPPIPPSESQNPGTSENGESGLRERLRDRW